MNKEQVITKITGKQIRTGKSGLKYLVLWTNPKKLIAFVEDIPEQEWDKIEVGNTYQLTIKEGKNSNYLLKDFTQAIVIEWPPKKDE